MSLHSSIPRIPFTADAYAKMQAEYRELLKEQDELVVRVNTARLMGDLSENGAYKYGKIELGNVRHRLRDLKHLITHGEVVTASKSGFISFGSTITLQNAAKKMTFTLVSEFESDPAQGKLSDSSPIGQAVKGKKIGDSVVVVTPNGEMMYEIASVE
ncbi:MAG: GreA/GreB family elongation factor [Patescibacteria group bacterium]